MKKHDVKISQISYVHDEEAASKWFEIYLDLLVENMKGKKVPAYDGKETPEGGTE